MSFNPRVLAGGRDRRQKPIRLGAAVSIHASSREDATRRNRRPRAAGAGFNPRVLAGGRDSSQTYQSHRQKFQSTRPRGRTRLICRLIPVIKMMFQSTRPRGRTRHVRADLTYQQGLFQSTRPRGRTRPAFGMERQSQRPVSIHASSREDATDGNRACHTSNPFQSTRPRGRTRL